MDSGQIREIVFREKLRGYHPDDVDAFVAAVAETVETLERRVADIEAQLREAAARPAEASEIEESLKRTLVLAQRTADLAVKEAQQEAAALVAAAVESRDALHVEIEATRAAMHAQAEAEARDERERLEALRAALARDVAALDAHFARERERLRIYFNDQLRRLDEGEPGVALPPTFEAPMREAASVDGSDDDAPVAALPEEAVDVENGGTAAATADAPDAPEARPEEEDAFLAELRRAVTDDAPLGPRDDPLPEPDDDAFDLFADADDDQSRFGGRLRRRR